MDFLDYSDDSDADFIDSTAIAGVKRGREDGVVGMINSDKRVRGSGLGVSEMGGKGGVGSVTTAPIFRSLDGAAVGASVGARRAANSIFSNAQRASAAVTALSSTPASSYGDAAPAPPVAATSEISAPPPAPAVGMGLDRRAMRELGIDSASGSNREIIEVSGSQRGAGWAASVAVMATAAAATAAARRSAPTAIAGRVWDAAEGQVGAGKASKGKNQIQNLAASAAQTSLRREEAARAGLMLAAQQRAAGQASGPGASVRPW